MKTYYTKCGKVAFQKSSTSAVTRFEDINDHCKDCPYIQENTAYRGGQEVPITFCQAGSKEPNHKTEYRTTNEEDATGLDILSLDMQLLKEINDFASSLDGCTRTQDRWPDVFHSMDRDDCRKSMPLAFESNKKGKAAKRAIIEKFFPITDTMPIDKNCRTCANSKMFKTVNHAGSAGNCLKNGGSYPIYIPDSKCKDYKSGKPEEEGDHCEDCKHSIDEGESVEYIKCSDKKRFVQKRQKACDKFEPWEKHLCIECLYCRRSEKSTDHPAPYKCFRAAHRDGQDWYFSTDSIACINFKPSAVACSTCKTDRTTCGSMYPGDYMYKDMKPCNMYTSQMPQRKYVDDKNRLIFVNAGLGGDDYMTMYRDQGWRDKGYGMHRLKSQSLPVRDNPDEAQADLDAYATKKGWKEYIEETKEADEVHIDSSQKCDFRDEQCPYYCSHNTGCSLRLSTGDAPKLMLEKMPAYNCDVYQEMSQKYLQVDVEVELAEVSGSDIEEHTSVAAFDYSTVDNDTATFLQEKEQKITQIRMMSVMAIGKELQEVHEKLANHYQGSFGKWCQSIGISDQTAMNYIRAREYVAKNFGNIDDADSIQLSLLFAVSKPSAPDELQKAVLDGDITTHKQYKELEQQLKAREKERDWEAQKAKENRIAAQEAEDRAKKAEIALKQSQDDHRSKNDRHESEVEYLNKTIKKLREKIETSAEPVETQKLKEELAEAKRQVEILTDELMKPVEVAPAVVEKIPEETERELANLREQTSQEHDYMFVSDILNMLRITHHTKLRNWAKVIVKENTETKVREIRNELIDFGTIFESMIDYLDEEIQKK